MEINKSDEIMNILPSDEIVKKEETDPDVTMKVIDSAMEEASKETPTLFDSETVSKEISDSETVSKEISDSETVSKEISDSETVSKEISDSETVSKEISELKSEQKGDQATSTSSIDTFAYLKRDEFTSEIFKIEINNLPKRCGIAQLKKKLNALNLKPGKVKVLQNGLYAFVNFRCEEDRQRALEVMDGHHWKGKDLKVKKANPSADPLLKKRKQEDMTGEGEPQVKLARGEDDAAISDRLNDAISPLWKMPYEEQLQSKTSEIRSFIKRLGRDIGKNCFNPILDDWLISQKKRYKGLCCDLLDIKPSPVLNNYRNKCEFSIGQSPFGEDKTVGFRLGRYKGGIVTVVEPDDSLIVTDRMKQCTRALQDFLQTESEHPGFEPESKSGNWKMALVRTNRKDHILMLVVFHPQRLSQEVIAEEKVKLQRYFVSGKGKDTPITSLYFRAQSDRREQDEVITNEHLKGDKYLEEELMDLMFRISPDAFFQVNTEAAEILYGTIGEWCGVSSNTVLLDICCGTGTIGLTMAKKVKKVVGVELCKEAVADAKANADLNGVTNATFYCGKAEDLLSTITRQYMNEDVVAVVDPPRAGLHQDVVRAIRKCDGVKRVVYVSCKATGAMNNLIDFTRSSSRRVRGEAFRLIQAVPVDLFPHTQHVELIMLLERNLDSTNDPEPVSKDVPMSDDHSPEVKTQASDSTVSQTSDGVHASGDTAPKIEESKDTTTEVAVSINSNGKQTSSECVHVEMNASKDETGNVGDESTSEENSNTNIKSVTEQMDFDLAQSEKSDDKLASDPASQTDTG